MANIKLKEFKDKFSRLKVDLRSNDINKIKATLLISDRPTSLIKFVMGSKQPRKQKGIKVKRRKDIKTRYVKGGKITKVRGAFIARGKNNNVQVFRRNPNTKTIRTAAGRTNPHIIKQSGPVIWVRFLRDDFRRPIETEVAIKFQKEFMRAYKFFLEKAGKAI